MKIELRNVKYAAFASQETSCFHATIYIDGKREGEAHNDGHGGSTIIHPYTLEQRLNAYGATLPRRPYGFAEGDYAQDAESLVGDLLEDWLYRRDLTNKMRKRIVFTKKGKGNTIYETKVISAERIAHLIANQHLIVDCEKCLNAMPFDEALAIYRATANEGAQA